MLSVVYKAKKENLLKKSFLRKSGRRRIEQRTKRKLFNGSRHGDKNDSTTSIRKHTNEWKVHEDSN